MDGDVTEGWLERPELLWSTTKLGREEYVQRLLATLVLGAPARGWNVARQPSERGASFLRGLHALRFSATPAGVPAFVDEFELPSRQAGERAGWPDHGVVWPDRLFIIELKTERRSHRRGQLDHYLDLAAHHHPDVDVDLLYVTPTVEVTPPLLSSPRSRYALVHWPEVYDLVCATWATSPVSWEATVCSFLARWIEDIEAGAPLPDRALPSPTPEPGWLALAAAVQVDGQQRAHDLDVTDPEQLEAIRLEVRDQLRRGPTVDGTEVTHVAPWIWRAETSGGRPLTELGAQTGYELRLSRYTKSQVDGTG